MQQPRKAGLVPEGSSTGYNRFQGHDRACFTHNEGAKNGQDSSAAWASGHSFGGRGVLARVGSDRVGPDGPGASVKKTPPQESPSPLSKHAATEQVDFGMVLKAQGGGFKNVDAAVTVPADWPDQQRVRVVKEDLPPGATVSYRTITDVGQRQMVVKIPSLPEGNEVRAVVTFSVERLTPPPLPQDSGQFQAASRKDLGKLASYLTPSPKIECNDPRVHETARKAIGNRTAAWEKVQAVHHWVHENIEFAGDMENVRTCMKTLELRRGVCAEMNSLVVAMLRAEGFPARLVRIPGHCYYEVYLVDGQGKGYWLRR